MNKMKEVAKMLGVELGEKFNIRLKDGNLSRYNPYYITEDGVFDRDGYNRVRYIENLLLGELTIEELSFKPKRGDKYYSVSIIGHVVYIGGYTWHKYTFDYAMYALGNCFKTEEEITEEIQEEMVKKLKGAYENGK